MVTVSKFFQNHVQAKTCQSLLIHTDSCRMHCLKDILLYTASNFKYFAPVCIIPAIIKLRSMNKEKLRNTLKYYLECSLIGTGVGYTTNVCICLLRNLLGHFGFYTFVFVPSVIGGCMANFASPRVIQLFETSMFQCNIETFFLMRRNIISRLVADSSVLQTYIFMICSAIILQGKHLYNIKGFWFLQPNPKLAEIENKEHNKCELHPGATCRRSLLGGMRKYFMLGLTLDLVKALMSKVDVAQNPSTLLGKVKNFRIASTALLTAYIGIYRFTHCFLHRHFPGGDALNHITAAFCAGLCYNFSPQSTLFSYALVQAIRSLWTIIQIENVNSKNRILRFLLRLPFGKILFPLALGNSVHLICLKPEYCSRLTATITNGVTNTHPTHIRNEIRILQEKFKDEIIQSTALSR